MMKGKQLFLLTLYPTRSNFLETITDEEKEKISEHFDYFKELMEQDILLMAGRCDNASMGLALIYAKNHDDALNIVKIDPAIKSSVFYYNLEKFSIALLNERLVVKDE